MIPFSTFSSELEVDCSQNYLDFKKLVTKMCKNDNDVITDVINYI